MERFAAAVVRWWPVVLIAWALLLVAAVTLGPTFSEEATYDDAAFLPPGSETVRGQELLVEGWPEDNFTNAVIVVLTRDERALDDVDEGWALDLVDWLDRRAPGAVGDVTTHLREDDLAGQLSAGDGRALVVVVGLLEAPFTPEAEDTVRALRERLARQPPPAGAEAGVTGTAAVALDENVAIDRSVSQTQVLTVVLVFALLFYIFRSPVAAVIPLATVGAAYLLAVSVVAWLASVGLQVSYLYETFAIVIVFGAGTDYSLLLISRFHEELSGGRVGARVAGALDPARRPVILVATLGVLAGVLASSAASTIVGFSAQGVARFGLFRTLGPAMAITIALTLFAGLTLTPALMRALGPLLYWPRRLDQGLQR